jgi:hypothetical protein
MGLGPYFIKKLKERKKKKKKEKKKKESQKWKKEKEISYIIRYVRLSAYKRGKKTLSGEKKVIWGG